MVRFILLTGPTRSLIMERSTFVMNVEIDGMVVSGESPGGVVHRRKKKTLQKLLQRPYWIGSFLTIATHVISHGVFSWSEVISQESRCTSGPKHLLTNTRNCRVSGFSRDSILLILKMLERWSSLTIQKSDRQQSAL